MTAASDWDAVAERKHVRRALLYRPQTERQSHYFAASAARQFDALVHIDHTRAVEPLERSLTWQRGEPPETYPTAL